MLKISINIKYDDQSNGQQCHPWLMVYKQQREEKLSFGV